MNAEQRRDKLYADLCKLEAYHQIENLMGRCTAAFNFRQAERVLGYFDLESPEVSVEIADEGLFKGQTAVTAFVQETLGQPTQTGYMLDMQLTTPIIEVAEDLLSARAQWWCPGAGSLPQKGEDPQAFWAWGMLAANLVLTDGSWKISNLHYFRLIKCDYHKGWVEDTSMINRLNTPMHPMAKPTTWHEPYSPLSVRRGIPAAPRPYDTYSGSGWMLDTDKTK